MLNKEGIDRIAFMVNLHESFMRQTSTFDQEVAKRLNIQWLPVFVPVEQMSVGQRQDRGRK